MLAAATTSTQLKFKGVAGEKGGFRAGSQVVTSPSAGRRSGFAALLSSSLSSTSASGLHSSPHSSVQMSVVGWTMPFWRSMARSCPVSGPRGSFAGERYT